MVNQHTLYLIDFDLTESMWFPLLYSYEFNLTIKLCLNMSKSMDFTFRNMERFWERVNIESVWAHFRKVVSRSASSSECKKENIDNELLVLSVFTSFKYYKPTCSNRKVLSELGKTVKKYFRRGKLCLCRSSVLYLFVWGFTPKLLQLNLWGIGYFLFSCKWNMNFKSDWIWQLKLSFLKKCQRLIVQKKRLLI